MKAFFLVKDDNGIRNVLTKINSGTNVCKP